MSPLVYILIVNYNGKQWLEECLKALYATKYDNFVVLFIDNDSADDSIEFVKSNFPQTRIIANKSNLGFCEGNNIGILEALEARAEYIVLLNGDTKVTEDWLTELVTVGEKNPEIGVLGAVQMAYSGTEFNYWTTTAAKEHLTELSEPDTARQWIAMRWVEGSCFAIKRQIIKEIGMLDPIYFMYYEELDYCRRLSAHGYQIALVPRSRIHHFGSGTSQPDPKARRMRAIRHDRSYLIYQTTDLQRSFALNLCYYFLVFGRECFIRIKGKNYDRIWDLISVQPKLLKSFALIRRKWKADRLCLKAVQKVETNLPWWYRLSSFYGESWKPAFGILLGLLLLFAVYYHYALFQICPQNFDDKSKCVVRAMEIDEAIEQSLYTAAFQNIEYHKTLTSGENIMILFEKILVPLQVALLALAIRRKFYGAKFKA